MDAGTVITLLMENVSRNGSMLLNLTQHGRGDMDPEVIQTCKDVGAWLKINGEAIYGSRPFEVLGTTMFTIRVIRGIYMRRSQTGTAIKSH